jgi:acyl-CoA reductase-like NAD-dependent aldehyde dehydrogenase
MRVDVIEPATEAVLSSLLGARPEDVDDAVEYAREARNVAATPAIIGALRLMVAV